MQARRASFAIAVVASILWAGPSSAGPISFNAALTLSSGEFVFREQGVLSQSGGDPSGAGRELRVLSAISVLGYGVDQNLSVFAVLPYVDKRLEMTAAGARRVREASGLGDARLFGRYTLIRRNWTGKVLRLSAFAGLKAPTGDDDASDRFGRLPAAAQPGSGSWDIFGGGVVTYQTFDFQVDGQLAYQANTEANSLAFGDVTRADASFQYRLWPRRLGEGVPNFLYGVIEANLIHRAKNRSFDVDDADSGGTTLFLSPGFQLVGKRFVLEAEVQVPVLQALNGSALENDFVVRAGFRVNF